MSAIFQPRAFLSQLNQKYLALVPMMDERMRRQWAATEASDLGWGGVSTVSVATGLARNTITMAEWQPQGQPEKVKGN